MAAVIFYGNYCTLIVYCTVQVSQVLSRSNFIVVRYPGKSLLTRAYLLLINRKETMQELTIISPTMFFRMYVWILLKQLLIGLLGSSNFIGKLQDTVTSSRKPKGKKKRSEEHPLSTAPDPIEIQG